MIEFLGHHFSAIIIFIAAVHFGAFLWILRDRRRKLAELKAFLQNIVRGFSGHSDIDPNASVDDQISRYIKDWEEALAPNGRATDREQLRRCEIKDEERPYLETGLETRYNVVRTAIEAYPLLGILGTLLAMAFALSQGSAMEAGAGADMTAAATGAAATGAAGDIAAIIKAFNSAIWSTVWGLLFAVAFMLFNASVESGFERINEHRTAVHAIVQKTKQLRFIAGSAES